VFPVNGSIAVPLRVLARPEAGGNTKLDGKLTQRQRRLLYATRTEPVKPGLTFHGLRHSHKTWMIADAVPEVAQSRRLGHVLHNKIQEIYSHVATEVEHRLLGGLNDRWDKAVANSTTDPAMLSYRSL
jgi:integrase